LPMPLTVHRRNGEPCPRCGDRLEAVFYEDYVMCYCPSCVSDRARARRSPRLAGDRSPPARWPLTGSGRLCSYPNEYYS
jgi:hypothetical protein